MLSSQQNKLSITKRSMAHSLLRLWVGPFAGLADGSALSQEAGRKAIFSDDRSSEMPLSCLVSPVCFHLSGPSLTKGRVMRGLHPLCLWSRTVTGLDVPVLSFVDRNLRLSLGPPKGDRKSVCHPRT